MGVACTSANEILDVCDVCTACTGTTSILFCARSRLNSKLVCCLASLIFVVVEEEPRAGLGVAILAGIHARRLSQLAHVQIRA